MIGPSPVQYYTAVFASIVSSSLSFAGSSAVIVSSFRDTKHSIYQQLVLAISLTDALGSFTNLFLPFLLPRYTREAGGLLWASGNQATCRLTGFFFVLCPPLVSFFGLYLSAYFLARVRYNTPDEKIRTFYFRPAMVLAVLLCFGLALTGAIIPNGYAPRVYHNICSFGDCAIGKVDECEYETGLSWYLGWLQVVMIVLPALMALGCTIAVYFTVRAKLRASRRFAFSGTRNQQQDDMLKATRTQAICYSLAYWNSFFWYFMFGILGGDDYLVEQEESEPGYFTLQLLTWIFFPLQGFLNFIVYTRPRYLQWRQTLPDHSRLYAMRQAVSLQPVSATAHLRSSPNIKLSRESGATADSTRKFGITQKREQQQQPEKQPVIDDTEGIKDVSDSA